MADVTDEMTTFPFAVQYWSDSGAQQRAGRFDPAACVDDDPRLVIRTYDAEPDPTQQQWDATARDYVPIPAPVVESPRVVVGKLEFLRDRLGLDVLARALARESSDPIIAAFRMMIDNADSITLTDPVTVAGVDHLASIGIVTPADRARIFAGVES